MAVMGVNLVGRCAGGEVAPVRLAKGEPVHARRTFGATGGPALARWPLGLDFVLRKKMKLKY